ncbi:hypothetical protein LR48_Vigan08g125400 [Vigna angularis]|uniref:EF-1-gamma C-terminal domain-containing protein n=1 Tax=Phaseolus angularis TaxID=3914 RepID=A0A0L9V638_PHAAN|nr:hypothetical protein LR48_Vigan08g125400 [Vigna angularis]
MFRHRVSFAASSFLLPLHLHHCYRCLSRLPHRYSSRLRGSARPASVAFVTSSFAPPLLQTDVVPLVQSAKKPAQPKESKPKPKDEPKKVAKPEPGKPKEEAEEEAPKPKPKNPLDLLPPSKMILDEWKRLYSNTKTNFREVAIKGFWDMYDPEGYSL